MRGLRQALARHLRHRARPRIPHAAQVLRLLADESARGGGPRRPAGHGPRSHACPRIRLFPEPSSAGRRPADSRPARAAAQAESTCAAQACRQPPGGAEEGKSSGSRENATRRLAALPAEERRLFQINSGDRTKLFCIVCRKPVNVETKSQTDQHISTPLHVKNKERYEREQAEGEARKSMVSEHFAGRLHAAGSSLTVDTHAARHEMVEIFMECAIPLDKLGTHPKLRRVLERGLSCTLGDVSDLRRNYVPLVEQTEQKCVRAEVLEERISVTFDSSQRNGDATVVVANWCTADFVLKSRLMAVTTFAKHMEASSSRRSFRSCSSRPTPSKGIISSAGRATPPPSTAPRLRGSRMRSLAGTTSSACRTR